VCFKFLCWYHMKISPNGRLLFPRLSCPCNVYHQLVSMYICFLSVAPNTQTHPHTHPQEQVRYFLSCNIQTWAIGFRILYYQISVSLDYYLLDYPSISHWLRSLQTKKRTN
jgi:hypothetical protein